MSGRLFSTAIRGHELTEQKKEFFLRRWFGGIGVGYYLQSLPFSVGMLVMPLVPTVVVAYLLQHGQAPLVGASVLLLTFGYPVLRAKRPRAAWWVGTLVAVGSVFGLVATNLFVGLFFTWYLLLTWALTIAFLVLNWKRLRPWTFAVFAAIVLGHLLSMEILRSLLALFGLGLMALYFRLPDRDNFPRAPLAVSIMMALLISHGAWFYFDVGGQEEISRHPAAYKVFQYDGQRRGWARLLGVNSPFLVPSCDGEKFYVGGKLTYYSRLVLIDPTSNRRKVVPMIGGLTDNLAQDCASRTLFVGNPGENEVMALNAANPQKTYLKEKFDGVHVGLLRLDRQNNRLYMIAANKDYLFELRASNLAEIGRLEFPSTPTDLAIDRPHDHEVLLVTQGGEVARVRNRPLEKVNSAQLDFGKLMYNLALDEKQRRVFVSSLFAKEIRVLDADTLAPIASLPVERGGRFMQFDPRRDLLYVGNFFTGTLTAYAFDGRQGRQVWSIQAGRRIRYLTLDRLRDQLCFTSQTGGFCLGLESLAPAPPTAGPDLEEEGPPAADSSATPAAESPDANAAPAEE